MRLVPKTKSYAPIIMLLSSLFLILANCSRQSPELSPVPLALVASFPPEPAPGDSQGVYIGQAVGMDQVEGLLLVSDQRQNLIHKFTDTGEYIGSIGIIGDGPGELRSITKLRADPVENGFWIVSHGGNRLVHLSLEGEFFGGLFLPSSGTASFALMSNGTIVMTSPTGGDQGTLFCLNRNGDVLWQASPSLVIGGTKGFIPAANSSFVCLIADEIWQVYSSFNIVRVFTPQGHLLREFQLNEGRLEQKHAVSVKGHLGFERGETGPLGGPALPRRIISGAIGTKDGCYIITDAGRYQPNTKILAPSIYHVDNMGEVTTRYQWWDSPGSVDNFVRLDTLDGLRLAVLVSLVEFGDQICLVEGRAIGHQ